MAAFYFYDLDFSTETSLSEIVEAIEAFREPLFRRYIRVKAADLLKDGKPAFAVHYALAMGFHSDLAKKNDIIKVPTLAILLKNYSKKLQEAVFSPVEWEKVRYFTEEFVYDTWAWVNMDEVANEIENEEFCFFDGDGGGIRFEDCYPKTRYPKIKNLWPLNTLS